MGGDKNENVLRMVTFNSYEIMINPLFLDIKCSNHMTSKEDWFLDLDENMKIKVKLTNNNIVHVEGK